MNNLNILYNQWKNEQKVFDKNISFLKQRITSEPVHDIRVSTKKLNAFLQLYVLLKQQPEWEYPLIKTKKLFNALGKFREIEICLDLIGIYEKETNYKYKQIKNYLFFLQKFTKVIANDEVHRYNKKELPKIASLLKQDMVLYNAEKLNDNILSIISAGISATKNYFKLPHKLRQHLKEIYYWEIFLSEENKLLFHFTILHQILDELGSWQDKDLLLIKMKHFRKDYLPKQLEEYKLLEELETKLTEEKKIQLKKSLYNTRKWLKKITNP